MSKEEENMIEINTGTQELLCHIENRVAVITLNKPHKKNALGDVLTPALRETLLKVDRDDRVGCVMITGTGDAFCAGGDISEMGGNSGPDTRTSTEKVAELLLKQETLTLRLHQLSKITVAALPGVAAGAGLSIALACDLRIASDNAFVTTAFRNIGLSGDYGASWFLPRLIGLAKARDLFFTARRVPAQECAQLGLFNEVFPQELFREKALAYVEDLANGPTAALGRMKRNLNAGLHQTLEDSLLLEAENLIASTEGDEIKEAVSAFMQKRSPRFHGD